MKKYNVKNYIRYKEDLEGTTNEDGKKIKGVLELSKKGKYSKRDSLIIDNKVPKKFSVNAFKTNKK